MLLTIAAHPIKVIFDLSDDLSRFADTKLVNNPFDRIFVRLAIITAILLVTQWQYVRRHSARTIRIANGYPMIGGYRMPQTGRSTADCAATAPVFKAALPVVYSQCIRQLAFTGAPLLLRQPLTVWVFLPPVTTIFWILFAEFGAIATPFIHVFCAIFGRFSSGARLAPARNSMLPIAFRPMKVARCGWTVSAALGTALKFREWIVDHSVSLSLTRMMLSAGGASDRHFGLQSLADKILFYHKCRTNATARRCL
jgi:hypothetical protein